MQTKRILLSLLGVAKLEPTVVNVSWLAQKQFLCASGLHQQALLDSQEFDLIWLVGTSQARNEHAHKLEHHCFVEIPKGETDADFWSIFETVSKSLDHLLQVSREQNEQWELCLDLTFGYRVQPMFLLEAVRYAVHLDCRLELKEVYYSILHDDRHANGCKEATLRKVSPILELNQVASEVHLLLEHSVVSPLVQRIGALIGARTSELERSFLSERPTEDSSSIEFKKAWGLYRNQDTLLLNLKNLQQELGAFGAMVGLNQTPMACVVVRKLCDHALGFQTASKEFSHLRPLANALVHLQEELAKLLPKADKPLWGWHKALAQWCAQRGLYQQALTHAEELVTTRLCEELGQDPLDDKGARSYLSNTVKILQNKSDIPEAWKPLLKSATFVNELRNRVNHASLNKKVADQLQVKSPNEWPLLVAKVESSVIKAIDALLAANDDLTKYPPLPMETSTRRVFVLTSHSVLDEQRNDLRDNWQAESLESLPMELQTKWSSVSPDCLDLNTELEPIIDWLSKRVNANDLIWVQGEWGMVFAVASWCQLNQVTAIYSTTERDAQECHGEGKVTLIHNFQHVRFRRFSYYKKPKGT